MRILIFNWKDRLHPAAGGAEVFVNSVARELVVRGHNVTFFAPTVAAHPANENDEGVEIVRAGGRLSVYRAARRFWRSSGAGAYDVVIDSINTRPFMTPRWVRSTPIVALIYQLAREIWFYETPLPIAVLGRYVLEPRWLRAYRDVPALTISESSAVSLRQHHGWNDVTVIPVGLAAIPTTDVAKETRPTVVFLGRLVRMKRPADAIEAFARLRREHPDARLWIVGTGPLEKRLRERAPPGVELLGHVTTEARSELLTRAHVLVTTSVREGWGLNVSEAAVCGTPSIAYAVPGLVDSVRASGGELVQPTPDALGDALVRFFDGNLRMTPQPGTATWGEVADAVEQRLYEVIAAHGSGAAHAPGRAPRDQPTSPHRDRARTPESR